jgi:hypothetical protein
MMNKTNPILVFALAVFMAVFLASPSSAADYSDDKAGYSIEYNDETWVIEDMEYMFGDLSEFDEMLVSTPLVLTNWEQEMAAIMIVVSERDDYENSLMDFIEEMIGDLAVNDIYELDDVFTDSSGDDFDSKVVALGAAPEFEEEGILLIQTLFADGKRFEICYIGLPDSFIDTWEDAIGIIDSIDID